MIDSPKNPQQAFFSRPARYPHTQAEVYHSIKVHVMVLVMLSPLIWMGIILLMRGEHITSFSEMLDIFDERHLWLLIRSLLLSLGISIFTVIFSWVVAVWVWTHSHRSGYWLAWAALPLAALPPYLHSLTWLAVFSWVSGLLEPLGARFQIPSGWWVVILVECAAFFPVAFGCSWLGLVLLEPEWLDAARISSPDGQNLLRVIFPLCKPALMAGGGVIFLFSLLDYGVPALHQVHTYAMEIFAEFSASGQISRVFIISLPLMFSALLILVFMISPMKNLVSSSTTHPSPWQISPDLPGYMGYILKLIAVSAAMLIALPLITMLVMSFPVPDVKILFEKAIPESACSFLYALGSSLLCVLFAIFSSALLSSKRKGNGLLWFLVMVPLAIPSTLSGISLASFASVVSLPGNLVPVLGHFFRFSPVAILFMAAQSHWIDPVFMEAAVLCQPSWLNRQMNVCLPLAAPGILAALGLVGAFSMGELPLTLMVVPPGKSTLIIRIYQSLHYGASQESAIYGLFLYSVTLIVCVLALSVAITWNRYLNISEVKE